MRGDPSQLTFPVAELIGSEVVLAAIGVLTEATAMPGVEVLRPENCYMRYSL